MLKFTKIAGITPQTKCHGFSGQNYHQIIGCDCYNLETLMPATKIRLKVGYSFSGRSALEPSDIPSVKLECLKAKPYNWFSYKQEPATGLGLSHHLLKYRLCLHLRPVV